MATTEELTAQLAEAKQAYHDLLIGVSVRVIVNQNGTRVEYTPGNRSALSNYIADLERQLAPASRRPGPMRVWF